MPIRGSAVLGKAIHQQIPSPAGEVKLVTFVPWTLVRRGMKREIILPLNVPERTEVCAMIAQPEKVTTDSALVRALGLAYHWQRLLDIGKVRNVSDIAVREGISKQRVSLILGLTQLAPAVVESLVYGASNRLSLDYFKRNPVPFSWEAQKALMA